MYRHIIRPILFLLSPEAAHHFVFGMLKVLFAIPGPGALTRFVFCIRDPSLERNVAGIRFPNPVGLAAGLDKDAKAFRELSNYGFGFIEIGTVTPKAQPGNEKPRMFRLPEDEALINRMGFNNEGAAAAAERLKRRKPGLVIGGNIGRNKLTPNEKANEDYLSCFRTLFNYVDYFVVNVSSPNTPGLRSLQDREPLMSLLNEVMRLNLELCKQKAMPQPRPVFLKIAPDLSDEQLDDIINIVRETGISGVVATNTTVSREGLRTEKGKVEKCGPGGLSGRPLSKRSTEVIRYLCERSGRSFPVIASGGIHSARDAKEKIEAGAVLVQVYTGFIYEGPGLVKRICRELSNRKEGN